MALGLRPATLDDAEFLYRLRTDPVVAAASNTTGPTDFEAHRAWLLRTLERRLEVDLLIIEQDGVPVGQARLDIHDSGRHAEVSIALVQGARGHGVGRAALDLLARRAHSRHRLAYLEAVIKETNVASKKAFLAAGYSIEETKDGVIHMAKQIAQAL